MDVVRDGIKGLTKVQKDYIHCLSFIHEVGDLNMEGGQIAKAGSSLFPGEPMLTMPDNGILRSCGSRPLVRNLCEPNRLNSPRLL